MGNAVASCWFSPTTVLEAELLFEVQTDKIRSKLNPQNRKKSTIISDSFLFDSVTPTTPLNSDFK